MKVRQWLAWKLVQIAHRLHAAEYQETVQITSDGRHVCTISVIGDQYGCGITSMAGIPWNLDGGAVKTAQVHGLEFTWSVDA
ncbi:hypothetical protein [Mycobacterium sp. TY814]|uniref:hypothetical protein n=1 Tax=Mycobacterium sp. TY814 TaxID=3050580 RepID=UPI0027403325|nr:hypothetical protein [Mycobacterium sp. TY814]MDP7721809.1 hypothetical protein [Mycobacterium sp. TY814]